MKREAESPGHAVCGAGSAARTMGFAVKVLVEVEPAFWELGPGERESLRKLPIASSSCWIGIRRELDLNQKKCHCRCGKGAVGGDGGNNRFRSCKLNIVGRLN